MQCDLPSNRIDLFVRDLELFHRVDGLRGEGFVAAGNITSQRMRDGQEK